MLEMLDQYQYLGNCPPTPPLIQQQSIDNKLRLMLGLGRGRWAVSQILILIRDVDRDWNLNQNDDREMNFIRSCLYAAEFDGSSVIMVHA